jgi:hypothetical protein
VFSKGFALINNAYPTFNQAQRIGGGKKKLMNEVSV